MDLDYKRIITKALEEIALNESAKKNVVRKTKRLLPGEKIRNAFHTAGDSAPWGDWVDYWEEIVGVDVPAKAHCARCGEVKKLEGAHVWIGFDDANYYIMPMCHECNTADNVLFVPMYPYEMAWVDYNVCTKGDAHKAYDKQRGYK